MVKLNNMRTTLTRKNYLPKILNYYKTLSNLGKAPEISLNFYIITLIIIIIYKIYDL